VPATAGCAALTYFSVQQPRDGLICAAAAIGGLAVWLFGVVFSNVTALVQGDLEHPVACIARPRYLGLILMAASTLTFACTAFNLDEKVMQVLYSRAHLAAAASMPALKLKGIIFSGNNSSALINGKSLHAGEELDGVMVAQINSDSVTVEFQGERRQIALSR